MDYYKNIHHKSRLFRAKKTIRQVIFKISMILLIMLGLCLFYIWYFHKEEFFKYRDQKTQGVSERLGFVVEDIIVVGEDSNCIIDLDDFKRQYLGISVFLADLDSIREKLETVDCIQSIGVNRALPNKLEVVIKPKQPIAIWQSHKQFYFIAEDGVVLKIRNIKNLQDLIIILGQNAPKHTSALLAVLKIDPEIYSKIVSAIWIGDRRWNIIFDNGTEVMLPENDYARAWQKFIELTKTNDDFKDFRYKTIDFRVKNRIYTK